VYSASEDRVPDRAQVPSGPSSVLSWYEAHLFPHPRSFMPVGSTTPPPPLLNVLFSFPCETRKGFLIGFRAFFFGTRVPVCSLDPWIMGNFPLIVVVHSLTETLPLFAAWLGVELLNLTAGSPVFSFPPILCPPWSATVWSRSVLLLFFSGLSHRVLDKVSPS